MPAFRVNINCGSAIGRSAAARRVHADPRADGIADRGSATLIHAPARCWRGRRGLIRQPVEHPQPGVDRSFASPPAGELAQTVAIQRSDDLESRLQMLFLAASSERDSLEFAGWRHRRRNLRSDLVLGDENG